MKPLSICEIAKTIGAQYSGPDFLVDEICTDTRKLVPGCLFVALSGDHFDGHNYIAQALEAGAALAVSHRPDDNPRILQVADTRQALLDIAGYYRKIIAPKVAAVTGSVGKTTTKEMTACVLERKFKTLKTPANLNNEVGLSQTLFMLEADHQAAMLELGVDGPGQMPPMSMAAAPDLSILTGIGVAHLANYKNREGIREEKLHIRDGMPDGGLLLINADNDLLKDFRDDRLRVLRYGLDDPKCEVKANALQENYGNTQFVISLGSEKYSAEIPAIGRHNVLNALAAFATGISFGVDPIEAIYALKDYRPEGMRQKTVKHSGFTFIEDCYNASPDSVQAALATLGGMTGGGKKIAVLSDMLELGNTEREDHAQIGAFAAGCKIDLLLCTGTLSAEYAAGGQRAGLDARHYQDQEALLAAIKEIAKPGDTLWFKASRGMKLEQVINRLYQEL
ncbi:MAG: UDP-N-acetylmuramoyl-tripeptide--D-alanyl-D-alanine ligase [Oscillospiraceae bacterium]|nr:UDP-N-acetylmuramoyl-tripeptide--D-alanyl-D-alanine ligase [Oscillospiraceae bacterium]